MTHLVLTSDTLHIQCHLPFFAHLPRDKVLEPVIGKHRVEVTLQISLFSVRSEESGITNVGKPTDLVLGNHLFVSLVRIITVLLNEVATNTICIRSQALFPIDEATVTLELFLLLGRHQREILVNELLIVDPLIVDEMGEQVHQVNHFRVNFLKLFDLLHQRFIFRDL